jgi:hypothetical protein
METVMHKHLANLTPGEAPTSGGQGSWYSAWKRWNEARALRKQERQHEELVSELPTHILYNIGESACRPRCSSSDNWDNNSYKLFVDAIARRKPSELDLGS